MSELKLKYKMNDFRYLEGQRVNGIYLGLFVFTGTVVESRVKYGGKIQHTIEVDEPFKCYGEMRYRILVDGGDGSINRILDERDAEYAKSNLTV